MSGSVLSALRVLTHLILETRGLAVLLPHVVTRVKIPKPRAGGSSSWALWLLVRGADGRGRSGPGCPLLPSPSHRAHTGDCGRGCRALWVSSPFPATFLCLCFLLCTLHLLRDCVSVGFIVSGLCPTARTRKAGVFSCFVPSFSDYSGT